MADRPVDPAETELELAMVLAHDPVAEHGCVLVEYTIPGSGEVTVQLGAWPPDECTSFPSGFPWGS